jgi:hypothetical protein
MLEDIPVEADGLSWGKEKLEKFRDERKAA